MAAISLIRGPTVCPVHGLPLDVGTEMRVCPKHKLCIWVPHPKDSSKWIKIAARKRILNGRVKHDHRKTS